ncbi:MAG: hypothetical protein IPH03_18620 [Tetrasphaera sp.]|jgi:hypothetical protein|nr:hypothetical protein [Tetrasphaera sp.]
MAGSSQQLVQFGDTDVLVEIRGGGGPTTVDDRGPLSFEPAKKAIAAVVSELGDAIRQAKPQEASVEIGFSFSAKTGKLTALIVEGGAEANLKVTLTWKAPEHAPASS